MANVTTITAIVYIMQFVNILFILYNIIKLNEREKLFLNYFLYFFRYSALLKFLGNFVLATFE